MANKGITTSFRTHVLSSDAPPPFTEEPAATLNETPASLQLAVLPGVVSEVLCTGLMLTVASHEGFQVASANKAEMEAESLSALFERLPNIVSDYCIGVVYGKESATILAGLIIRHDEGEIDEYWLVSTECAVFIDKTGKRPRKSNLYKLQLHL